MNEEDQCSITMAESATYQIEVQGHLDQSWADAFGHLDIEYRFNSDGGTITRLTGAVADQAALAGVLNLAYMLGMPLLAVKCLE